MTTFGGNKQGERSEKIVIELKPALKALLERAAADQFRSRSGQAATYVVAGLMRDGYIHQGASEVGKREDR